MRKKGDETFLSSSSITSSVLMLQYCIKHAELVLTFSVYPYRIHKIKYISTLTSLFHTVALLSHLTLSKGTSNSTKTPYNHLNRN